MTAPPSPHPSGHAFRPLGWFFLVCLSGYLLTAGGHLYSADTEIKAMITDGLVTRHSIALPSARMMYMIPGRGGLSYSPFPPGTSLTMIPSFLIGDGLARLAPAIPRALIIEFSLSLINQIVSALTCTLVFVICRHLGYPLRSAVVTALVYGFCTVAWPYAKTCWSEPQATLCLLIALYGVLRFRTSTNTGWLTLAGTAIGYGILTKYETGIYAVTLGGLVLHAVLQHPRSWKRLGMITLAYGMPLAVFGGLILFYNYLRFEHPLDFGHYIQASGNLTNIPGPFDPLKGIMVGIYQHLFSSGKSLLLFSPPLLLWYWGMKAFWRTHRPEAWFCLASVLAFFIAAGRSWEMSYFAWGERYFMTLTPLLVLPLIAILDPLLASRTRHLRKATLALIIGGFCTQLVAISVNYQTVLDRLLASKTPFTIQTISYDPEYSPLYLNFRECLQNIPRTWTLLEQGVEGVARRTLSAEGPVTTATFDQKVYRDVIRFNTYDFWFCYMYFTKFPKLLITVGLITLSGLLALSIRRLCQIVSLASDRVSG